MFQNTHPSWRKIIKNESQKKYFQDIEVFLQDETRNKNIFYPERKKILRAFEKSFDEVKVVILWQDPYHGVWQAHWLSFSVSDGTKIPPSLKNIFKELQGDIWCEIPESGNLEKWSWEWVLLLNAILSVRAWSPASHSKIWWENFSDEIIKILSEKKQNLVFILWGKFAQSKQKYIDETKHLVICSPHPSPFSAYSGFFGSKPFSTTNLYLQKHHISPINWEL